MRALFNWAIRTGHLKETPFKHGSETVIKLAKEPKRSRRLQDGEEERLLAAAGPHLRAVIECALETGMRRGEIMSLQWHQVVGIKIEKEATITSAPRSQIFLPVAKTKTKTGRPNSGLDAPQGDPGDASLRSERSTAAARRLRLRERDRPEDRRPEARVAHLRAAGARPHPDVHEEDEEPDARIAGRTRRDRSALSRSEA